MYGTIDLSGGPVQIDGDSLENESYHRDFPEYHSRGTTHSIFKMGGIAQRHLERGVSLFSGNAGTRKGSQFDYLFEQMVNGKKLEQLFVQPPAEVLTSNGQRRGKAYEQWAQELAANGGMEATAAEVELLRLMRDALLENQSAVDLLDACTDCQRSVFWADRAGHKRKARWDGATKDLVFDVKTTSSQWCDLHKSFDNFGYYWQAGWYSDSAYAVGFEAFQMPFICVQTVPPYECQVVTCPDEFVDRAREQIARTLDLIELRRETGEYLPEDYGVTKQLEIPAWAWKGIYQDADAE